MTKTHFNNKLLETLAIAAMENPPVIRNYRLAAGVVFKHKDIVSIGFPQRKSHPIQKKFATKEQAIFLHAEVDALLRALRITKLNEKDYSLYVARVKRKDAFDKQTFILGDATPCTGCQGFIHFCGLSKVVQTHG